jgi:hypothetical protein
MVSGQAGSFHGRQGGNFSRDTAGAPIAGSRIGVNHGSFWIPCWHCFAAEDWEATVEAIGIPHAKAAADFAETFVHD